MTSPILNFFKKTYKIFIILLAAIIFFLGYNTYLVDRSLSNLRLALNGVDNIKNLEDAKKLALVLESSLFLEVASKDLSATNIAKLEIAKGILTKPDIVPAVRNDAKLVARALYSSLLQEVAEEELQESSVSRIELAKGFLVSPQDFSQLEEVKFALKEVIKQKEDKRSGILVALDRINAIIAPAVKKLSQAQLEGQARSIKGKISQLKEKGQIQASYYELGNIYTQLSYFDKAKDAYRKAIEVDAESKLARKCQFNLAWNEKLRGNLNEALKEFQVISQSALQDELNIFSHYQIADTLRQSGDYKQAAEIFLEVAKKSGNPDLAQLAESQAGYTYLYDLKDYEKARIQFNKIKARFKGQDISAHMEAVSLPSIGKMYLRDGFRLLNEGYLQSLPDKYKEALVSFRNALRILPKEGTAYMGQALVWFWLDERDRALTLAKKAVKLSPADEVVSVNLGFIYIRLGLTEEAIVELKRYASINPFTLLGYYNLGCAYVIKKNFYEAATAFRKATKVEPNFVLAYNNLGWCYWQLKQYAEAIEAFEKAIKIQPDFLDGIFNLGLIYKSLGRNKDARKEFEAILKIDPAYPQAQLQLNSLEKNR